jgi:hypothetical protein
MRRYILASFLCLTYVSVHAGSAPKVAPSVDRDADLSNAPDSYKKRILAFRKMMRKEPDRASKIALAIKLVRNPKSKFRIDAINFLTETRAQESVPVLIQQVRDPAVEEFAIFALGEVRSAKSVPVLIESLSSENENARGNAERALAKVTRTSFSYTYSASPEQRKTSIREIEQWWKKNKTTFVLRDETPEERKAADEAWEKYGKQYISDLSR